MAVTGVGGKTDLRLETVNRGVLKVPRCAAKQGDTVCWQVGNRTVSIWFPMAGVFESPTLAWKQTGEITVVIPPDARDGEYEYVIYCHDTDEFAECNSHPIMVIPGP